MIGQIQDTSPVCISKDVEIEITEPSSYEDDLRMDILGKILN